jgi:DNA-binding MarR family transcriptional regulator
METRVGKIERGIEEWFDVLRLVWTIDHKLQSVSTHLHRTLGVTGQQRLVIKLVGQSPGISAGEIAEVLRVHQSSLSATFKRLVENDLLERRVHEDDARKATFFLTEHGQRNDATLAGTAEAAVKRTLSKMPPERIAGAKQVLADLVRELDAEIASFAS